MMRRIVTPLVCLLIVMGAIQQASAAKVQVKVATVTVSPLSTKLNIGKLQQLSATAKDSSGTVISGVSLTWSSDASSVATVDASGLVTAVSHGTAHITATAPDGVSGSATLTVQPPVASVSVSPASASIIVGQTQQLSAVAKDVQGNLVSGIIFTWSSDAASVATVNASGQVSAVSAGIAHITATAPDGVSSSATLTVQPPAVASVRVSPASASITVGQTQQLSAVAKDARGNLISGVNFTWSSDTVSVASVSASGLVSALSAGTAHITATAPNGVSSPATLTVQPPAVASVSVSPASASITVGQTQQLSAVAKDAKGNLISGVNLTWSSDTASVATVSASGLASAISAGTAHITATAPNGVSSSTTLTVQPPAVASVSVSPASASITVGQTQQLSAVAKDAKGNLISGVNFTWSSDAISVAAVNTTGLASALTSGTAHITATAPDGVSSSATLTVQLPAVASVSVPSLAPLTIGEIRQLSAVAEDANGHAISSVNFAWSSNAPSVATVTASGLASGLKQGTVQITATAPNGVNGSVTLAIDTITSASIPANFFGMNQVHLAGPAGSGCDTSFPFTNAPIGAFRTWNTCHSEWAFVEPTDGTFNWAGIDTILSSAHLAGVDDVELDLARVPQWASTNPSDPLCQSPGTCDPPTDVAPDGTGTDLIFRTYVAALLNHISDPTYLLDHAHAPFIEIFEEFHRSDTVGGVKTYTGTVNTNGTSATFQSGMKFLEATPGDVITIAGKSFTVLGVPSNTDLVLSASAGKLAGATYTMSACHAPGNGIPCSWRGTFAQMLRMTQDLRCLAKGNAADPITALNTTCGEAGYGAIGLDPNVSVSVGNAGPMAFDNGPQTLANYLYCNQAPPAGSFCNYGSAGSASVDVIEGHAYFNSGSVLPEEVIGAFTTQASLLSPDDLNKPYLVGEGGWSKNTLVTDPTLQAAYVARWYLSILISGVGNRAYWWSWDLSGPNGEGGLWSQTEQTVPPSVCTVPDPIGGFYCTGGISYMQMVNWLSGASLTGVTCPGDCSNPSTGVFTFNLSRPGGYQAQIVWDSSANAPCTNTQCGSTSFTAPAFAVKWRDLEGNSFNGLPNTIGASPIIVENGVQP